ncbi:ABC transporter ATP-binding protein [Frisingicoccus caecimuris]|uniref:ABC-2 type transport system ATP-binding protein n=1 Tax=Frisingicoccus caecimuris TaxID=1796636 RepID=A0A4R2LEH6_9FIRM|nr:ABC transporter ATP-binding protein [Frisingicoccus caecimuris]MCR1918239.1 ABC transporter ATP-binding protein [Frisingicoccus caecimuris]TCO85344.1 ABC-2 type transport system ATP-binding protein [Frisingicoccus caecimuris]
MKIIQTENLTKYYGKARGIIDMNLSVEAGDIFGFIGPNGAGKSTTIRTLLGLISPTSGNARIFEQDILKNHIEILSRIGYMPSEAMFYHGMRVEDVLRLSASLHGKNCLAEAHHLCERFKLDTKKKVEELSLGNRKKVSIVCGFMHQPDLYILDEPTSGLDPLMQKAFFELIHERNSQGATIFLSSHILSEIQHHCKNAAIIREGCLIACDSVEKLTNTKARRITLHGISSPPRLENMKNISCTENSVSFLYDGNMKVLIAELNQIPITDMTVTEPELEEIFLHYYTKEADLI